MMMHVARIEAASSASVGTTRALVGGDANGSPPKRAHTVTSTTFVEWVIQML